MFSRSTTTIGFACTIFYACSILLVLVVAGNGGLAFKIPDSSSRRPKVTRTFALARENLPPPTCPEGNPNDDVFRGIRSSWPVPLQNWLTENGLTRTVQDSLIYLGLPALVQEYPAALWDFFHISTSCTFDFAKKEENADGSTIYARRSRIKSRIDQLQYGQHKSQFMDLIEPYPSTATSKSDKKPNGVAVFVHGGAWGSGQPWMYRLVSLPFLEQNMAVAIVGYRTYPDTNVDGQVADVGSAIEYLATERPDLMNDKG